MHDIQPLLALREFDRTGSLTRATARLSLTQSAVSAIPGWLLRDVKGVKNMQLGDGITKSIYLGRRARS